MQGRGRLSALALLAAGQLLALVVLALTAHGAGHLVTRRLATASRGEALAVASATGLGVVATLLFWVALAGALRRWLVVTLAVVGIVLGIRALLDARRRPALGGEPLLVASGFGTTGLGAPAGRVLAASVLLVLLPTLWWSLFPPTGFDATTYHLPFARAFVEANALVVVPELLFPVFPQLAEVLAAAMLLVSGSEVSAHLVQFLAMALPALLLWAGGRRLFSPAAGLWAPALWLSHPLVHYQAASAYVDLVLAHFCLLAVYAWEVWREGRTGDDQVVGTTGGGWLVLAGAAAGFAAATKYLGLAWLGLLVLFTLVAERRRRLAAASVLLVAALAVAGPWYARIHHHTGNPIHPLLEPLFTGVSAGPRFDAIVGIEEGDARTDSTAALARAAGRALTRVGDLPAFAWKASFDREEFDRQSALAPWNLVLVPLAALFCWRDRRLLRWLLLVTVYAVLWTTHDPRFQLPSVALLALAGAGALDHLGRSLPAVGRQLSRPLVAGSLAALLAAPGPAYAIYKIARLGGLPPATPEGRARFLDREIAGHAGIRRLNELHGDRYTVFAIWGQRLTYYADGRLLGHVLGPYRQDRVAPLLADPEALDRELRTMGVTHLMVVHDGVAVRLPRGEAFDRRFRWIAGDGRFDLFELPESVAAEGTDSSYASPPAPVPRRPVVAPGRSR